MTAAYQTIDWYRVPRYYDLVFSSLNRSELRFLEAVYERYQLSSRKRILEPACGSGRLLAAMAARGFRVEGFDLMPEMVDYARERLRRQGLPGGLRQGDMASFSYQKRFDLAYCLVSSFKYLRTESQARSHLQCVADVLVEGGVYVLGLHLTDYENDGADSECWTGKRGTTECICQIDSWPPERKTRTEKLRSRLRVKSGARHVGFETHWSFRTYDARQLRRLLAKVPDLSHVATHNFEYRIDEEYELGEDYLDSVIILQKR